MNVATIFPNQISSIRNNGSKLLVYMNGGERYVFTDPVTISGFLAAIPKNIPSISIAINEQPGDGEIKTAGAERG